MSEAEGSGIYDAEYSDSDSDNESETDLSEESGSDSSDSEEDEEDDDDDEITEESQIVEVQEAEGISSDEGSEKESCPICLNRFIGQDLGIPESCDHIFCLECIREWSKNINTCPIDRNEFNYVNLKSTPDGKVLKKIKVKVRPKEPENALQQEVTLCEVCHLGDREDRLLLCDACDLAYHCECLDPPLFRVPIEEWFCPPCSGILQNGAVAGPSAPRSRRVIPRTRASENVRTRVQDRRTRPAISRSPSNARKRAPQKRKRRAYRRSYKKVVTLARTKKNLMDGSKGKDCPRTTAVIVTYRRRRRRRKRRRVSTKTTSARKSGAKKRISKHLGLVKSSKGGSIPDVKAKSKSSSKSMPSTGSSHYLFGDRNQLMDFNESYDENAPGPSRRQQEVATPQPSTSSINILDSIMAGQKILHTKSNDVIIKTDGSLVLKENKIKEKVTFKKPFVPDKAKDKELIRKPNVPEKSNEKEKGAVKKSSFGDKTKDQRKRIIKKSEVSNKEKSNHVKFGEPSNLGAIPKMEKHSERKPSPMLLAALARRRENEKSYQSVSDYESCSSSSLEGITTSTDNHQQTDIGRQNFPKQPLLSLNSKISQSSSSYESVNKSSNYSHESSLKKSARANRIKSDFDDFKNSGLSDSSSDSLSFSCIELNTSRVKYEAINERSLFKHETTKESPKHSFLSVKQEFNNVSRLHDTFNSSFESTGSARQSCITNENRSSNGRVKKTEIQKYIKKEEPTLLSEKSSLARSITNTAMLLSSETEINSDEDTMEFPSQSLIPENFDALLTSYSEVKQLSVNVKKETDSFSEKSECFQSLVEPLHKQLESNSQSLKKSLTNKVSNLKLKIKKELESSDEDCLSQNGGSNHSFNNSHGQTMNAIRDDDDTVGFEDSQSIISQTVTVIAEKTGEMSRQRFKGEMNSSDDETNSCPVSKSDSQSKSMNNLRNNKYVSVDSSKIKIKEEPPSSEDEGGESCSLLNDDLPFTQLAERDNVLYTPLKNPILNCVQAISSPLSEEVNDLPCSQLAEIAFDKRDKSLSSNKPQDDLPCTQPLKMFDELDDDLPCTQFVKPTPVNYLSEEDDALPSTQSSSRLSGMQMDNLPSTQLMGSSSVKSFSKENEDALPCTQLAGPISSMGMEDLPCTQFVLPAAIKDISVKEEEALPATRPSSPRSQMETDDLPYTQLAEPSSKNSVSKKKDNALPCAQLAKPVSKMEMEDLPFTQLATPLSCIQIDDLPATQSAAPTSVKYSKRKLDAFPATQPTFSLSQIQTDDLPCTQLVEPSSKYSVSTDEDALPCTQLVESSSRNSISDEEDTLPCTQLAQPLSDMEMEELPCTQVARPLSNMQKNDLSSTQFLKPAPVKCLPKRKVDSLPSAQPICSLSQLQADDLPSTQLARPLSDMEMEELPCTQLARPLSNMQKNDLPSTQFLKPAPVKCRKRKVDALPSTQPTNSLSQLQTDDLPSTQLIKPSSEYSSYDEDALPCTQLIEPSSISPVSNEEEDTLPCTQLAKPVSSREMEDLPCTQLAMPSSNTQTVDLPSTQFTVPAPANCPLKKKVAALPATHPSSPLSQIDDLPCTQLAEPSVVKPPDQEEDLLPCTQVATPVLNLHSKKLQNANVRKNCEGNLPATQPNTSSEHSSENSENLSNLNSNLDDDFDLPETQSPTFDQHHLSSKKLLQKNSNDEKVTNEKLLSNIDKLKIKKPTVRKAVGVHKNLPQVLMPIPARRLPVPKPSNRNTFSFDQVKQQCDAKDNKDSFKGSVSFRKLLPDTKIVGDLSTKGTQSSVLEKKQQMSSECKAENINNFKEEKSRPGISVSSVPNFDVKGKIDKSNAPTDSDIEIIDSKMMKIKKVEELVLSSDEEDLPATQLCDRNSDHCSNLPNQRKLEKIVVKKEINLDDFQIQDVKALNLLPIKQEKCEETISAKIKMEPLQQLKTEEKISRSIKTEKKSHNSEDTTIARNIQCVDKCTNQKISSTKNLNHENVSRSVRGYEKHVREHTNKADLADHNKKTARDRSSSSVIKIEFEKVGKRKTEGSSETRSHSNAESRSEIKNENRRSSKTTSNSEIKLNTENTNQMKLINKDKKAKTEHMSSSHGHANGDQMNHHKLAIEKSKSSLNVDIYHRNNKKQKHNSLDDSNKVKDHKNHNLVIDRLQSSSKEDYHEDSKRWKHDSLDDSKKWQDHKNHKLVTEKPKSFSKDYHEDSKRPKPDSLDESKKVQDHKNNKLVSEKSKSSSKENYEDSKRQKRDSLDNSKKVHDHKNHKLVTEKSKSSKEDNYHEDSKRRKHDSLDNSKSMQNHKKLKVNSLTVKKELSADKSGKHDLEKSLDNNKEEVHVLKNIIMDDSVKLKSSQTSLDTERLSNSGNVKESHVSNGEKSRNGNKSAKIYDKTFENQHSNKSSSEKSLKLAHSNSHDNKRHSDFKSKKLGTISLNDQERLNVKIKTEPDSEKKVNNQSKSSKTNFKNESSRTGSLVKRSDSSEGERSTKRPRLESFSCNEDTSDCHSDYSRSSVISSESNFQKKYKHQRNALNSLNEIADEIISTSKNHNADILNQDENIDLEVIKRSKDPSLLGRKVDKAHLKDEIANEVKIALKPFYSVGLIDKEDYKDIMRKAVPKIYMNCGNYVHPEKIKNLVTGYVKKLTNS